MILFYLTSLAGLIPRVGLPVTMGGRTIHPFDPLFLACLAFAWRKNAFKAPDRRLVLSGLGFIATLSLSMLAHPSGMETNMFRSLGYSIAVVLVVSHIRLEQIPLRVDRVILVPLFVATAVAWMVFFVENLGGIDIGFNNNSQALPPGVFRLGGITGGNVLILFLCLAAPLVRGFGSTLVAILIPSWATFSRSLIGVGAALLARERLQRSADRTAGVRIIGALAVTSIAIGLAIYAGIAPTDRDSFRLSIGEGAYVYLHASALRLFLSRPIWGVGAAGFLDQSTGWAPHSALLGLAAQEGLIGLAGFCGFVFEIAKRLLQGADPEWRASSLAGVSGLLIGGLFVDWLLLKGLWFWIGLMVAESLGRTSPKTGGTGV